LPGLSDDEGLTFGRALYQARKVRFGFMDVHCVHVQTWFDGVN
jgi:hypothetical protein